LFEQIVAKIVASGNAQVAGQAPSLEELQDNPPRIELPAIDSQSRGLRKGMMIVVPTFSMREKTPARNVGSLNSRSSDDPSAGAGIVGKVRYDPVARHANRHPDEYAPHDPIQPT
jgi:hypothetical protein